MLKQVFDKPRIFPLDQVPDNLGNKLNSYDRLKLLTTKGDLLVLYKSSGAIVLVRGYGKEVLQYPNTSPILVTSFQYPFLFSVHENDVLQVLNIENKSCEKYAQIAESLKRTQAILLDEREVYCITPGKVLVWQRANLQIAPKEIAFVDSKSESRPLINPTSNFCKIIGQNTFLLGNMDMIQVWKINKSEMSCEFEGHNTDPQKKLFFVDGYGNNLVAASHYELMVWNSQMPGLPPRLQQEPGLITSLYIDDSFILVGNNAGVVTLRQVKDGAKLYELTPDEKDRNRTKTSTKSTPPPSPHATLIDFDISKKINAVDKIGRWVFVACENSRVQIFDMTKEKTDPVLEYLTPPGTAVRNMIVDGGLALISIYNQKDKFSKPDLLLWTPKLPGLEWFDQQKKKGSSSLTTTLAFNYSQIVDYLSGIEKAGEEVTEFTITTDRVQRVLLLILNNPNMDINFLLLRKLQTALDDFQDLLEKLTQQQSILRFFSSNRLRRDIEVKNTALHFQLNEVEGYVKSFLAEKKEVVDEYNAPLELPYQPSAEYASLSSQPASLIHDVAGREFWNKNFGDQHMVDWQTFITKLKESFPRSLTPQVVNYFAFILDYNNTGLIGQYKFSEFLKGFGPFSKCIDNVNTILNEPWFHGFLSSREADYLIRSAKCPDGTFLVRFSKSKPGSFAMAFKKGSGTAKSGCKHILIESCQPDGFKINEVESQGVTKTFASLHDIISHYSFVLKQPLLSDLPQKEWFFGDLSTEEAKDMLAAQPNGTFLIRFSSKGCFAASFTTQGTVKHVLIVNEGTTKYTLTTGEGQETLTFGSLDDLVNYYYSKGVFLQPHYSNRRMKFSG